MSNDHIAPTREAYGGSARRFAETVGTTISPAFEASLDVAVLDAFAELVRSSGGPVVDAGCGTGRVARHLADVGLAVIGVDVAPGMIDEARTAHPDLRFEVAALTRLPCPSASLGGIVCWYSIITTPPDALGEVWRELRRALAPGGAALVAFQCGVGEPVPHPRAFGTGADLTLYRHDPRAIRSGLEAAGFTMHAYLRRAPWFDHESSDQTFIVATGPD